MGASLEVAVGLAHDVRSPLGAIMALAEVLESGASGPVTEQQRRLLTVVREAALSLSRITTDIVDAARSGTAGGATATPFEIQDVLGVVQAIVQPMAEHAGLKMIVTSRAPRMWVGAPTAITRVLLNLTTNALKYTERGTVECGARQVSPTRLQFFVRDTGGGMVRRSKSVAAQQPQWKRSKSGLGLAISRELVRAMGSSLTQESRPGVGCCFQFELNRMRRVSGVES